MRFVLVFWLLAAAGFAQVVPGRYVVEIAGQPAAIRTGRALAVRRAEVKQTQAGARSAIANLGGTVLDSMDTVVNALIVSIPDSKAAGLAQIPGVVRVHTVRRIRPLLNHALPLHKVPDAWSMLPQGMDGAGAGIKIGMIDTGIDVTHPAFSDALPPVAGFPRVLVSTDKQFTNAKIIVAKNFTPLLPDGGDPDADDYDGHGTGTSMAAAGGAVTSQFGPLSGVAPKAYLGNYKVLDANGSTSDVIAKAIDEAVADGMDVLNISIGGLVTSYSDIAPDEIGMAAIENATKAGVIVAVAAGNSGPGAGTIGDYASAPDAISAGAMKNDRSLGDAVIITGVAPYEAFPGDGTIPNQPLAGPLVDVASLDPTGLACSPLPSNSVAGAIVLILRGTCTFESKINNVAAGGALAALIYNDGTTNPFTWGSTTVGLATLPAMFANLAEGTDLKARIAASPGLQATLDFSAVTAFPASPDLSDFSSRGPSIGSALKPDLLAVGEEIVTGAQRNYTDGGMYDPSGFVDVAGTSFSSPLTAGAAAVLKAARPGLTVAQYRSLLVNGALPGTSAPGVAASVPQAGSGVLNLASAISGTLAAYPTSLNFGTGSGTINNTLNLALTNVGSVSDTYAITVVPSGGSPAPGVSISTLQLDPQATQQVSVALNASSLAPGAYQGYLTITGTANSATVTIPYWFAVPGSAPSGIAVLYSDNYDPVRTLSQYAVIFRITELSGLPYSGSVTPTAVVSADSGSVRSVYPIGDIPGTYALDIRTGTTSIQIDITAGDAKTSVIIPVY